MLTNQFPLKPHKLFSVGTPDNCSYLYKIWTQFFFLVKKGKRSTESLCGVLSHVCTTKAAASEIMGTRSQSIPGQMRLVAKRHLVQQNSYDSHIAPAVMMKLFTNLALYARYLPSKLHGTMATQSLGTHFPKLLNSSNINITCTFLSS